jgi:hypothetical protein
MSPIRKTWIGLTVLAGAALLVQPAAAFAAGPRGLAAAEGDAVLLRVRAAVAQRYASLAPWYAHEYGVDASAALWGPPFNLAVTEPAGAAPLPVYDEALQDPSRPFALTAAPQP